MSKVGTVMGYDLWSAPVWSAPKGCARYSYGPHKFVFADVLSNSARGTNASIIVHNDGTALVRFRDRSCKLHGNLMDAMAQASIWLDEVNKCPTLSPPGCSATSPSSPPDPTTVAEL